MPKIKQLHALEILDSRGRPTIQATCELAEGVTATASVPSGASRGAAEALELRDGDAKRYRGLGCRKAVENVKTKIAQAVCGLALESQTDLDNVMLALDGTENKSNLGANAILAVSIAFARAHALLLKRPLYQHFAAMAGSGFLSLGDCDWELSFSHPKYRPDSSQIMSKSSHPDIYGDDEWRCS